MATWTAYRNGTWEVTSDQAASPWYDNAAQSLLASYPLPGDTVITGAFSVAMTAPTEPVTRAEAKLHARIDTTADDSLIDELITAARKYWEERLHRKFLTQTVTEKFDAFPSQFRPQYSPLIGVTSIHYNDTGGTDQTLASSVYTVDTATEPGRISLDTGQNWPAAETTDNAVTLTYTAGYGAAADVPGQYKVLIKMLVTYWYDNRAGLTEQDLKAPKFAMESLFWGGRTINV